MTYPLSVHKPPSWSQHGVDPVKIRQMEGSPSNIGCYWIRCNTFDTGIRLRWVDPESVCIDLRCFLPPHFLGGVISHLTKVEILVLRRSGKSNPYVATGGLSPI